MSHMIDQSVRAEGAAFYADKPAWHQLGIVTEGAKTSEEAIKLAGLDWIVEKKPIYFQSLDNDGQRTLHQIEERVATVRMDSQSALGIVSPDYHVVQNIEGFDILDGILNDEGIVYESAGSLADGKIVWMLARIPKDAEIVAGDTQKCYLLLTFGHDGRHALKCVPTMVRVVCWNTLSGALASESDIVKIEHWGGVEDKIVAAKEALTQTAVSFDQYVEIGRRLAEKRIKRNDAFTFYTRLITGKSFKSERTLMDGDCSTRAKNVVLALMHSYEQHPNQTMDGVKGTAWAAVNAVTQWSDHERTTKGDTSYARAQSRFRSNMIGEFGRDKVKAFKTAEKIFLS